MDNVLQSPHDFVHERNLAGYPALLPTRVNNLPPAVSPRAYNPPLLQPTLADVACKDYVPPHLRGVVRSNKPLEAADSMMNLPCPPTSGGSPAAVSPRSCNSLVLQPTRADFACKDYVPPHLRGVARPDKPLEAAGSINKLPLPPSRGIPHSPSSPLLPIPSVSANRPPKPWWVFANTRTTIGDKIRGTQKDAYRMSNTETIGHIRVAEHQPLVDVVADLAQI